MNEALVEIAKALQLAAWAVGFTATLTFLGVVITAVVLYQTRGIAKIQREIQEEGKRISFYLFNKLGPFDTKWP